MTFEKVKPWTDVYECRCPVPECGRWVKVKTKEGRSKKTIRLKCTNHILSNHRILGRRTRSLLADIMVDTRRKVVE